MPKLNGKENTYDRRSNRIRSVGRRCIGNYRLPQEAENHLIEDRSHWLILMLRVTNTTRGVSVGDSVELADTSLKRMFGLLGRRGLNAGGGLWIKPSSGVHTFGMAFKIDVIGLDSNLKVIKLWRCLVPFRVTSVSLKLKSVMELPCGTISRSQTQAGDQLQISTSSLSDPAPSAVS